jgi:hypothetical protein
MADGSVDFTIGTIKFQCQGEQEWVSKQLGVLLLNLDKITHYSPRTVGLDESNNDDNEHHQAKGKKGETLPTYLISVGAKSVQVKKFLATAYWLTLKGQDSLTTTDVNKAIKDASQNKLNNASECLAQNIKKGFCEREGESFKVVQTGIDSLSKS